MDQNNSNEEFIVIFEAPKIIPPEFRLYYDKETGKVVTYTCQNLEGDYIVIDAQTYAQARPDVIVRDGKITTAKDHAVFSKLMPSEKGLTCVKEDISIIAPESYSGVTTNWEMVTYEL